MCYRFSSSGVGDAAGYVVMLCIGPEGVQRSRKRYTLTGVYVRLSVVD